MFWVQHETSNPDNVGTGADYHDPSVTGSACPQNPLLESEFGGLLHGHHKSEFHSLADNRSFLLMQKIRSRQSGSCNASEIS